MSQRVLFSSLSCNTHLLSNYYSISNHSKYFSFSSYVTFFFFLAAPWRTSLSRDWTHVPAVEVQSLDHWTTGEVQCKLVYIDSQAIFRLILRLICAFNKRILKSIRNPQIYLVERGNSHWSSISGSLVSSCHWLWQAINDGCRALGGRRGRKRCGLALCQYYNTVLSLAVNRLWGTVWIPLLATNVVR